MSSEIPTVYEWAGGRAAFQRWLGRFYDLVEDDDQIAPLFGGRVGDQHRRDVVTWWCEVMGGPATYSEELGGYEHMVSKHRGLHITGEQRRLLRHQGNVFAQRLEAHLANVPAIEQDAALLRIVEALALRDAAFPCGR